ncbi:YkvA family protein [Geoalkalibacter halelectricus]|uniref:DUF1232 domain-containing protein n=1 Tax=Geoalkalibacter halelectricus TaxID=2847045 RepID=A0ABY5ZFT0_9BACT|nr:DUF1232 domain-containing protein [Geoalkalibacter halelectricus]MDO3378110.1 DUF1232 domain-containing protein [Geoalkalibacter halelectricus]UWZ77956.1 DUF1232 domain-containing protein [Geoalkalibacter halelectricus]
MSTGSLNVEDFWRKIGRIPKAAGSEVVRKALLLYLVLTDAQAPLWVRGCVTICLLYFLWPLDAVPDYLPGGYLDDLAAMTLLLVEIHVFVTPALRQRADQLMPERFRSRTAKEATA